MTVSSHAVEPAYEYGDLAIVDTSSKRPSPGGVFVYWDGMGAAFANMVAIPSKDDPKIRISARGADDFEITPGELEIIGRVKGRWQKGQPSWTHFELANGLTFSILLLSH